MECREENYVIKNGREKERDERKEEKRREKREEKKIWFFVYMKLKKMGILKDDEVENRLLKLGFASYDKRREQLLNYRRKQISIVLFGLSMLCLFGVTFVVREGHSHDEPITIERNRYGDGEKTESIYADGEKIEFSVGEQKYDQNEVEQKFQEAFSYAQKNLLGENESYDHITRDLNFFDAIPDSGIKISWTPEDYELIDSYGKVQNEEFDKEQKKGVITSVTGVFSYGETVYEREYPLCIYEREMSEEESKKKQLMKALKDYERGDDTKGSFQIPTSLNGFSLQKENEKSNKVTLFVLGIILIICLVCVENSRLEEKIKARNEEILMDYPVIVNQLVLYLGAGMTIQGSFSKMNDEYQKKREENVIEKKYAYEEIKIMMHQLQSGVSQEKAYYDFGQRVGLLPYIKIVSFITQNLYQGSRELLYLLEQEEENAFRERVNQAKKLGEEAGTKLLFPMILLLIVVMLIVMVPALLRFGGM